MALGENSITLGKGSSGSKVCSREEQQIPDLLCSAPVDNQMGSGPCLAWRTISAFYIRPIGGEEGC